MAYTLISDPAHGWLSVKTAELIELGIVDDISAYSYISPKGDRCYLEEDSDTTVFINAMVAKNGKRPSIRCRYTENTKIRNYPNYQPTWINDNASVIVEYYP